MTTSLDALLDDVRIYNRALSTDEIQYLYQMGTPEGSSAALPQGCPNIGDVCDDGTIYVGLSPDGNEEVYTTPCNWGAETANGVCATGSTIGWGSSSNRLFIGVTDSDTGELNTKVLAMSDSSSSSGFQEHAASKRCLNLVAHSASDWYLPSSNEYGLYYSQRDAIGGFATETHWTSTESDASSAMRRQFSNGATVAAAKSNGFHIRCARKGPAPRCANPYGLEGEMLYNTDHDVVQYCDGARWVAIGKAAP